MLVVCGAHDTLFAMIQCTNAMVHINARMRWCTHDASHDWDDALIICDGAMHVIMVHYVVVHMAWCTGHGAQWYIWGWCTCYGASWCIGMVDAYMMMHMVWWTFHNAYIVMHCMMLVHVNGMVQKCTFMQCISLYMHIIALVLLIWARMGRHGFKVKGTYP